MFSSVPGERRARRRERAKEESRFPARHAGKKSPIRERRRKLFPHSLRRRTSTAARPPTGNDKDERSMKRRIFSVV